MDEYPVRTEAKEKAMIYKKYENEDGLTSPDTQARIKKEIEQMQKELVQENDYRYVYLKSYQRPSRDVLNRIQGYIYNLYHEPSAYTLRDSLNHIVFMSDGEVMDFLRNFVENANETVLKHFDKNQQLVFLGSWKDRLTTQIAKIAETHKEEALQNKISSKPSDATVSKSGTRSDTGMTSRGSKTSIKSGDNKAGKPVMFKPDYNFNKASHLMRFIRNLYVHFKDVSDSKVKTLIGVRPSEFILYFGMVFPALYSYTYTIAKTNATFNVKTVSRFQHNARIEQVTNQYVEGPAFYKYYQETLTENANDITLVTPNLNTSGETYYSGGFDYNMFSFNPEDPLEIDGEEEEWSPVRRPKKLI